MGKYQAILSGNSTLKLQVTLALNPASPLLMVAEQPPEHDCLEQIGLNTQPLAEPEVDLFMDGSSFVDQGRGCIQYVVKTLFFFFCHTAYKILVPQPGIKSTLPAVEVQSLNHWTAREVLWC